MHCNVSGCEHARFTQTKPESLDYSWVSHTRPGLNECWGSTDESLKQVWRRLIGLKVHIHPSKPRFFYPSSVAIIRVANIESPAIEYISAYLDQEKTCSS